MTNPCKHCGAAITFEPIEGMAIMPNICGACEAGIQAGLAKRVAEEREARWAKLCPPAYRDTDINHPDFPKAKAERVLAWKLGPRGLVLHGKTGKGKSRAMWLLAKQLFDRNINIRAMTSGQFARDCADSYRTGDGAMRHWFDSIVNCDVFFLDDLGKFKLTDRVEADLFEVIEHLTSHGIPILTTCNHVGDSLAAKMSEDRGPAIVRRLREFCESISFL